jgi:CheY-like chemotaxis protein
VPEPTDVSRTRTTVNGLELTNGPYHSYDHREGFPVDHMVGHPLTILVVDDTDGCRELYALWLPDEHEVVTAPDGRSALETMRPDVDLVLLDREMRDIGGVDVAHQLRADGHDAHVVMVSSHGPDLDLVDHPIDDYRQKPIDEEDLLDVIAEYRTRERYTDALEQFFALTAKVAALEASHSQAELAESDQYARLTGLIEEKRAEVDSALSEAAEDWSSAFKVAAPVPVDADQPST